MLLLNFHLTLLCQTADALLLPRRCWDWDWLLPPVLRREAAFRLEASTQQLQVIQQVPYWTRMACCDLLSAPHSVVCVVLG